MRVLVLLGGDRLYGQELANLEVFRNLTQLGLKARFITRTRFGRAEIEPELERMGIEWTTAPFGYHWSRQMFGRDFGYFLLNVYGLIVTSWIVWREVRRWRPTHLYVMNWTYFSYAAPVICTLKLPLVYRAGDELPTHTALHRWLTWKLVQRVNGMVCISKYILKRCAAAGMPLERMRVIYNYPPERARTVEPRLPSVPEGAIVAIYLGQVSIRKGVVVLLDAVERMIKEGSNLVLWVVGEPVWDDELLVALKQRVAASGLGERIVFFGYVRDVFPLLTRSDIHVCPTLSAEPLSNVVGEAKLCGKPSVIFSVGGLPELIEHGVDGYICRNQTVEALVEGIDYFVTDGAARRTAGEAARRSLEEKFGEERFRRDWVEVFTETASRST
jgi:glycosyltransferase involved in cell wall biosynthesis